MLIGGIALGLVLGLLLGGRLEHLADIRLRFLPLLFLAVIVRFATEAMLGFGVEIAETLRVPLLAARTACCCSRSGTTARTRASRWRSSGSRPTRW